MQEGALGPVGWNVLEEKGSQQRGPPVFALLCCGLVLIDFLDYVCIEIVICIIECCCSIGGSLLLEEKGEDLRELLCCIEFFCRFEIEALSMSVGFATWSICIYVYIYTHTYI